MRMASVSERRLYIKQWLSSALSQSIGAADLWSSIAGAVLAVIVHFFPESESAVNALLWQVPLWALASVLLARLVVAPYWLWRIERRARIKKEEEITSLNDKIRPRLTYTFNMGAPGCVVPAPYTFYVA